MPFSVFCAAVGELVWLFGYGSIVWRPGFDYARRVPARIEGYKRRFWQQSVDHRGTPELPGRVVTLIADSSARCEGVAYGIACESWEPIMRRLDHRERGGYVRVPVDIELVEANERVIGLTYVARADNPNFAGPATEEAIAEIARRARGPSGENREYVLELHRALEALGFADEHVRKIREAL